MLKKIISTFLLFFLFTINIFSDELKISSEKYILYNLNDQSILLEKNANDRTQIASLTKIMTVIIAIEKIDNFDKKITITNDMIKDITKDISIAGFEEGEVVSYNDLLYGAMLPSGADAVNALAISISGSIDEYLSLMNSKAIELGLSNTHFSNVIGLTDDENYSTAFDIAQLLMYALNNNKFREVFTAKSYILSNGKKVSATVQRFDNQYILGSKTGYTTKAGRCLASISKFDDVNYLMVTLNNYNKDTSFIEETVNVYKYYNENYSYKKLVDKNDIVVSLKTKYAKEKLLNINANIVYSLYLKNDFDKKDVKLIYSGVNSISYFTKTGKILGKVKILYKDELIDSFDLVYNGKLTFDIIEFLNINKKYIIGMGLVLIILLLLIIYKIKSHNKI
jgi:D-alanyl-D-alanine carboxypeptidase (penicillin-binding protein 5/6)